MTQPSKFANVSDDKLIAELVDLQELVAEKFLRICEILLELNMRGRKHDLMKHRLFQNFEAVARGKMLADTVIACNGNKFFIDILRQLSPAVQVGLITGAQQIAVARFNPETGTFDERQMRFFAMRRDEMKLVFDGNKILTYSQQVKLLKEKMETDARAAAEREAKAAAQPVPEQPVAEPTEPRVVSLDDEDVTIDAKAKQVVLPGVLLPFDEVLRMVEEMGFVVSKPLAPRKRKAA